MKDSYKKAKGKLLNTRNGDDGDDAIDLYMEGASGDDPNGLTQ